MSKIKKVLIWIGAILLLVLIILYILGVNAPKIEKWKLERQQVAYDKMVQAEIDKYKQDFDGGKTPEETLDLFLVALKAGDIDKASRYYEISVQGKALASLKEELRKQGNLEQGINYTTEVYKKGTKKCNEKGDGCTFRYEYVTEKDETVNFGKSGDKLFVPAGSRSSKFTDVGINRYTEIWKIEQPF